MERTLSQNEAKVILDLEWRNQKTVTLAELREALGASAGYARKLAHGLVKKGWLERLRPGLFQLVPAARGREGVADTNPLAAGAVLVSPYFFSFGTACTHHGLTEQVFGGVSHLPAGPPVRDHPGQALRLRPGLEAALLRVRGDRRPRTRRPDGDARAGAPRCDRSAPLRRRDR